MLFRSHTATVAESSADVWTYTFADLPRYAGGEKVTYEITESELDGYDSRALTSSIDSDAVLGFVNPPKTTEVKIEKVWDDDGNRDGKRPASIDIDLYADGGDDPYKTVTLTGATDTWTTTVKDLPQYNAAGDEIEWTVDEAQVAGYDEPEITGDAEKGFTVTNTYEPETTTVPVTKIWDDANDQDGKRPASLMVYLLADGKQIASYQLDDSDESADDANVWEYTFEEDDEGNALPLYRDGGQEVLYVVTEAAVEDYTPSVTGDAENGFEFKNSYTPGKTSVTVTKAWDDADDQDGLRPDEVTVELLADEQETGKTLTLTANEGWTGTFTDLDTHANGELIEYTVAESNVPEDYESDITGDDIKGFIVTNTHEPATKTIGITKVWADDSDIDGNHPTASRCACSQMTWTPARPSPSRPTTPPRATTTRGCARMRSPTCPSTRTARRSPTPSWRRTTSRSRRPATTAASRTTSPPPPRRSRAASRSRTPTRRRPRAPRSSRSGTTPTTRTASARPRST